MVENFAYKSDVRDLRTGAARAGIAKTSRADFREFEMPQIAAVHPKITGEATREPLEPSHAGVLFRIAQKELRSGNADEQKIWLIIGLCGAAAILYSVYLFLAGQ